MILNKGFMLKNVIKKGISVLSDNCDKKINKIKPFNYFP